MIEQGGWVYIMSSHSRCLYVGVTSDLHGRVREHKNGVYEGFSKKYKTHDLVISLQKSVILSEGEQKTSFPSHARCRARVEGPRYFTRMIAHGGWVYIMSSHSRCLYVGVTSDLHGRVWEHKNGVYEGFSKKYKTHDLVISLQNPSS